MEIIDCQIHAPHDAPTLLPEASPEAHDKVTLRVTTAVLDAAGVDAALINWTPAFCELAYRTFPDRFRSVLVFEPQAAYDLKLIGRSPGYPPGLSIPFSDLDDLVRKIGAVRERVGLVGIRLEAGWRPDARWALLADLLKAGAFDPMCEASRITGLPLCMWMAGVLPEVGRLARDYPDATLIVDHLGLIPNWLTDTDAEAELVQLLALARHPNVNVKFSGVAARSLQPYPFGDMQQLARVLVDHFGPDRLMWGSDYTMHPRLAYAKQVAFLRDSDLLTNAEKAKIFGANLRRIHDWPRSE